MRLGQLLVFLDKDDFLFTSKKFLFSCCTMDCSGAPGHLEDNYIRVGQKAPGQGQGHCYLLSYFHFPPLCEWHVREITSESIRKRKCPA